MSRIALFLAKEHGLATLVRMHRSVPVRAVFVLKEQSHEVAYSKHIIEYCNHHKIEVHTWPVKRGYFDKNMFDIMLAVKWRYMFSDEIRLAASNGCFAIHDSLLPKYRGASPLNWAIINGEAKVGATLFQVDCEMDSGDILEQENFDIECSEKFASVESQMLKIYEGIVDKFITRIESKNFAGTPQNHDDATYCCRRTPGDGEIDWNKKAIEIFNLFRALSDPAPGCFSYLCEKKIEIIECVIKSGKLNYVGTIPGRVVKVDKAAGCVDVLTADGIIEIRQVRISGKIVSAATVLDSITKTLGK
ncbi:methionyl-tRNA formyltransferase [Planktomarina temperata]|nr:methionyl-tRNA formyltransferase [Planktomarina temperata]